MWQAVDHNDSLVLQTSWHVDRYTRCIMGRTAHLCYRWYSPNMTSRVSLGIKWLNVGVWKGSGFEGCLARIDGVTLKFYANIACVEPPRHVHSSCKYSNSRPNLAKKQGYNCIPIQICNRPRRWSSGLDGPKSIEITVINGVWLEGTRMKLVWTLLDSGVGTFLFMWARCRAVPNFYTF
jgi:hypothetical protein